MHKFKLILNKLQPFEIQIVLELKHIQTRYIFPRGIQLNISNLSRNSEINAAGIVSNLLKSLRIAST